MPFGALGGHYGGRGSIFSRGGGASATAAPSRHGLTMTLVELLDHNPDIVTRLWPASSLVTGLKASKAINGILRKSRMWKDVRLVVKSGCGNDEVRLAFRV
jgi:hypothetical protein